MKKEYIIPIAEQISSELEEKLLGLSSPGTGIGDGGEGDDEDDPSSKDRYEEEEKWGDLW